MRARMDEETKRTGLNFSLLATPAEGLSGRFVKMDRERYDNGSTYLIEMNTEWRNCAFLRKVQAYAKIITKNCSKNL